MGTVIDFAPFLEKRKVSQLSPEDFYIYFNSEDEMWTAEARSGSVILTHDLYEGILELAGWPVSAADDSDDFEFEEEDALGYEEM